MMARTRFFPLVYLVLFLGAGTGLHGQVPEDPLVGKHAAALAQAQADHAEKRNLLAGRYAEFVDRLRAKAQNEGELEPTLALLAEVEHVRKHQRPGDGEAPAGTEQGRVVFLQQLADLERGLLEETRRIDTKYVQALDPRIQELTRAGNIPAALALTEEKKKTEARLAATASLEEPPAALTPAQPRLGPNLLRGGAFDEDAPGWHLVVPPGSRNRTEIYSEPNSNRNKALRIHQHENEGVYAAQRLRLEADKTYQITWRARLIRPWRAGIETRGMGNIRFVFEISWDVFSTFPPQQQKQILRAVEVDATLPTDVQWQTFRRTLTAGPHMNQLILAASKGEGEYLIDDVEVREILPEPAP